ncbi:MAG: YIP1 family protein [Candidatus Marinimicrobia bacterium]|jgi:hypothetical protein|nr:YIP1 family protein [Candidatus Neomarinimicrobiota bacterium]
MQEEVKTEVSFFYRFVNVFLKPSAAFQSIKAKMTWKQTIIPIIILILVSMIGYKLMLPVTVVEAEKRITKVERLTNEQKTEQIQKTEKRMNGPIPYIGIVVSQPIIIIVIGAIFLFFGNIIGGGKTEILKMIGVALYVQMLDIVASIIKIPLMLSQRTVDVQTSLALLFPEVDKSNVLYNIAAQFDIFTIWKIILWIIAFEIIYKYSAKKSSYLVIPIWVIVAAVSVFFSSMNFGG